MAVAKGLITTPTRPKATKQWGSRSHSQAAMVLAIPGLPSSFILEAMDNPQFSGMRQAAFMNKPSV
jgi:hypothetical protein